MNKRIKKKKEKATWVPAKISTIDDAFWIVKGFPMDYDYLGHNPNAMHLVVKNLYRVRVAKKVKRYRKRFKKRLAKHGIV